MTDSNHSFWSTQPVGIGDANMPVNSQKPKQTSVTLLPQDLYFATLTKNDIDDIYTLLLENYVEDCDSSMRLTYSKAFLEWQFTAPGQKQDYMLGVKKDKELKGFVFAMEHSLQINKNAVQAVSINFLCICKTLRNKRLAPLVIKEITRIANSYGIYQAIFTGGIALPFKLAEVQYFHRILDIKALVDAGYIQKNAAIENLQKKYAKDKQKSTSYRLANTNDYNDMFELYKDKCKTYKLYDDMSYENFCWSLQTRNDVTYTYVKQESSKITAFGSFYILNTLCMKENKAAKTAYLYYYAASDEKELLDALFLYASILDCAMFNILNIFDNKEWFDDLLLQPGDGFLKYYMYNWKTTPIAKNDVYFMLP